MMVGLPGSGKSTLIKQTQAERKRPAVVLSSDQYILDRAAEQGTTYSEIFQDTMGAAIIDLKRKLKAAVEAGDDIILDQTNLTLKSRKEKLGRIPDTYTKYAVVVEPYWRCNTDEEKAAAWKVILDRVDARGKDLNHVPYHVMKNMHDSFVRPEISEGFDVITTFDLTGHMIGHMIGQQKSSRTSNKYEATFKI
jgi:predicted kinase